MSQSSRRLAVCVLFVVSAGISVMGVGGCSKVDGRAASFRGNPTPELDTASQRHDDIDNKLTITNDTNFRIFTEELGRALLLDNPSRMTAQPSGW